MWIILLLFFFFFLFTKLKEKWIYKKLTFKIVEGILKFRKSLKGYPLVRCVIYCHDSDRHYGTVPLMYWVSALLLFVMKQFYGFSLSSGIRNDAICHQTRAIKFCRFFAILVVRRCAFLLSIWFCQCECRLSFHGEIVSVFILALALGNSRVSMGSAFVFERDVVLQHAWST